MILTQNSVYQSVLPAEPTPREAFAAEAVRMMEATLDGQVPIGEAGKYMIEHVDKEAVYALFDKACRRPPKSDAATISA